MKLPKTIFGINTEEAYARWQKGEGKKPDAGQNTGQALPEGFNKADYIFIPERNLYIAKQPSYHEKNWHETHEALHKDGKRMPTIREFVDFLNILKSGNAINGLEQKLPEDEAISIYKNITEVRDPWRSEWLDARFEKVNGVFHINYNHRIVDEELKAQNSEPLEDCLMQDKRPGIDLEYWLKNATPQGLPPKNNPDGKLYYWQPRDGAVARFDANSDGALLDCSRNPRYSNSSLGVYPCAEGAAKR